MEKNQKQSSPILFDVAFTLTSKSEPYIYLNILLITIQFVLFLLKIYDIIDPTIQHIYSIPYSSLFTILAIITGVFVGFTLFSYTFEWFPTIWFYFLLLLQAIQMIYVEVTVRCFVKDSWCQADSKSKLLSILVIIVFSLIIGLRLQCYNPVHDSLNALAMKSGKTILYSYIYAWLLSFATNQLIISSSTGSKQIVFLITACYYSFIFNPPTFSPIISRTIILCSNALFWTSGVAWLMPLAQELLGGDSISFWYYWGYSLPIVLLLSFLHSSKLMNSYDWKALFFQKHSGDLTNLFLQVNELNKQVVIIKKSDLGTNSPEFRKLWKTITIHNDKCLETQCPLASLNSLKIIREDQLLEEKRFNRTVQKTLQFGLYCLISQRQTYPNLIALSLQIANFQLQVFRLRTKGLQLYNKQWNNAQTQEKWAIYFMKKRIQSFEGSGEASSGEREQVIASFKHQIQKSVGMLAEFWYFLSDPKCNLKKLYDLANVLFPQKRRVDQAWKFIRDLKNVDCHALYAKYLIRMFNDKEKGLKVLEQAKRLQLQAHQKQEVSAGQVASEEHGVIFLQFDGKNSGVMYQVNSACERIFGYNKGELQGRKVNDIMPRFFAQHHDRILQNYQQTNRPKMMNKQRSIWGRSKNGYCFPFLICIKPVRNYFSQTNEVYASVKRDLWLKQKAFFFVDPEYNITDISASMLGLYPQLAGRVYLKKKIQLSQILPDYQTILPRLVQLQETHDLEITRTFNLALNSKQTFSQTLVFILQAEQIVTAAAGKIGYYLKLTKAGGANTSYDPGVSNQSNLIKQKPSGFGKQFKLMASLKEGDIGKKIIYQGGLIKDTNLMKSQMISRISQSIAKQKQFAKQQEVSRLATDWAGTIKIKRLQGTLIRQIHDLSEESELNGVVGGNQNSQDEGESSQVIKPCELNAILQRQKVNKPVLLMKILAVTILVVCTLLDILDYLSIHNFKNEIMDLLKSYADLSCLQAQTMYVNNFANRIIANGTQQEDLDSFAQQVFDLDSFTSSIPYSINQQLYYSDGTSQSMLLSFAINKLVSQSDLLASSQISDTTLFFVQYNAANGLQVGCQQALKVAWNYISVFYKQGIIFLVISLSLLAIGFLIQNIVLRRVLDKKADILNIFFQIPRYTCTFLQKECERFIQKLTNNEQQEDIELQGLEEEGQNSSKKNKTQKKRTIMGEEKTATEFLVISFLMIGYFLIYPVLITGIQQQGSATTAYTLDSIKGIISIQRQVAKAMSFMNTHIVNTSFPLSNQQNAMTVISEQYSLVINLLGNVSTNFFYIGDILDQQYIKEYNALFYGNLCQTNSTCNTQAGQDKGLNFILLNYIDYLVSKYLLIRNKNSYNLSTIYSYGIQTNQENYKKLLKNQWRKLQVLLINGYQRFLQMHDSTLFGLMLTFSVLNLSVLLWVWLKFYNQLQKKIKATQYILTFIPLDQINKNKKIVKYIKQKIVKIN